ncbi:RNA polymerase sigma factor [Dyadobacter sp. CY323]|uniref:RNA polymerase sigma factor n=1 Tax=Dyadobacter sp. CY323 TaxID=2907302 RepID=UPI001F3B1AA9|nr:sigma-70 family RNA polymerase sigma factor [Dyadobacter sp. CY323]MCE6989570.1 sigma-70 family RNA polymerase sigma factor [Dyadobacter sp. CY323]
MEYHLLSDELLVRLMRVDDAEAFSEVYKRFWRPLFQSARYKVKSEEIAEELLQDMFLNLWEKRTTLQIENLGAYLFGVLKYQIVNHYRALFLAEKYADFTQSQLDGYVHDADLAVNIQDIVSVFNEVLQQLPPKTSRVFHMSRLEFKTNREIAAALDITERTVEHHITQSLKLLRQQLRDFLPLLLMVWLGNI